MKSFFSTKNGRLYLGDSLSLLKTKQFRNLKGKVNLIITSPPFPLINKKQYGNEIGEEYKNGFHN